MDMDSEKRMQEIEKRLDSGSMRLDNLDRGQLHIIKRLDLQDERSDADRLAAEVDRRLLKDIRGILLAGSWGFTAARWLVVTAAAVLAAWASWKGLK